MGTNPIIRPPSVTLTAADLAFIDAAINLQLQEQKRRNVSPGTPVAPVEALWGTIFLIAEAAAQVVVWAYHCWTGRCPFSLIVPRDQALANGGLLPSATLDQIVAQRNEIAKSLGVTSVLQ